MKTLHLLLPLLFLAVASLVPRSSFGQGALTPPPGPPAPTMKSLDQVEARIMVNATNTPGDATNSFIISAPGSYYFTGNLTGKADKHGISIQANDVTLDLNGFALVSGGGAGLRGVDTPAAINNLTVRNGSVRGWTGGGVWVGVAVAQVEKLRLVENTGATGLTVGNGSIVKDCVATANATGFFLPDRTQASNCIATVNTGIGFNCTAYVNLLDCTSSRNGSDGIVTLGACNIIRCTATRNIPFGDGIRVTTGCNLSACTASNNGGTGIRMKGNCTISASVAGANGENGISSTTFGDPGSTITDCTAHSNVGNGINNHQGSITNCAANYNGYWGLYALEGIVSNSSAHYNSEDGIFGDNVSNSAANHNGKKGIYANGGTVAGCNTANNGQMGIYAADGAVSGSKA